MVDYVVDTNVWVEIDKSLADVDTLTELDCIKICRDWLGSFMAGEDRLIIDLGYEILKEYRRYVKQSDQLAYEWLNALERAPRNKLVEVQIEFDENRDAIIPFDLADEADRKFVAVALAHEPTPPIVDATDTDWSNEQEKLDEVGIEILELCPDYIEEKLAGKQP